MKALIIGYITAVINNYTRSIETLKECGASEGAIKRFETIREELNDLLDFVEDIPEWSKEPVTLNITINSNEEVEILRKRIRELEDSCENMCEVQKNQLKRIEYLKDDNYMWQNTCNILKEKLEGNK